MESPECGLSNGGNVLILILILTPKMGENVIPPFTWGAPISPGWHYSYAGLYQFLFFVATYANKLCNFHIAHALNIY